METAAPTKVSETWSYEPPAVGVAAAAKRSRVDSVDLLRGLVMVIMMLDHTRDFVHSQALLFEPTDLTKTYPILFFTRWITHFCAPAFVFLAGTGSYFQVARGKSKRELSRFLVTRGLWLIFLELTVVRIAAFWTFNFEFLGTMQVIWALGWCMIVLAALIHLRLRYIAAIGILMIALHNLADSLHVAVWQSPASPVPSVAAKLWMILHQGGAFPVASWPSPVVFILYPLIPWIGVMALGYVLGRAYDWPAEERRRKLVALGGAITIGFIAIRLTNLYGDPAGWSAQKSAAMTVVSFLDTQKYPPSLLYLMMTLGPAIMLLGLWESFNGSGNAPATHNTFARSLITFGRVPLFFYLLQWPVAHMAGYLLTVAAHKNASLYFTDNPTTIPPAQGF
ncbi:MAG: DUF1624 domain-containing protein, partial [Gemmatimonas sp.]